MWKVTWTRQFRRSTKLAREMDTTLNKTILRAKFGRYCGEQFLRTGRGKLMQLTSGFDMNVNWRPQISTDSLDRYRTTARLNRLGIANLVQYDGLGT